MQILGRLIKQLTSTRQMRQFTPQQVRELIDRGDLTGAEVAIEDLAELTKARDAVSQALRAEIAFRQFRDDDAEAKFRNALKSEPGLADAHYGLALVMVARGEVELALRHAQFATNKGENVARFNAQLGLCHLELRNFSKAQSALARATRLDPEDKSSWNNLGIALRAAGDGRGARKAFFRALEIDPAFSAAQRNLQMLESDLAAARPAARGYDGEDGSRPQLQDEEVLRPIRELASRGRIDAAIDACESLCSERSDDLAPVSELYNLYRERGDVQSGIDALQSFVARFPDNIDAVAELGKAFERAGDGPRAKPLLERALTARPDDVSLLLSMANVRMDQSRYADAGVLVERAFALEPTFHMKGRLASTLVMRCKYQETLKLVDEMLVEAPLVADAVAGIRVEALTQLGRHDEALPILDDQLLKRPYEPGLRFPRATIHLLNERFEQGWEDYAFRNLSSTKHLRMVAFPQWQGEPLQGKRILVLAEQGLGDQVMFASCLPDLLAQGPARVVVEVINRVAPTIARSFPTCEIVPTKQDVGLEWVRDYTDMDYFIPIGDLPQQFRRSVRDFPRHDGYLRAEPGRVAHWRDKLAALGPRAKVGLTWRGGTEKTRTVLRTMRPWQLGALAKAVEVDWICLQYGDVTEGLREAAEVGLTMHHWKEAIDDLDEFAALISALDMVVTVCNTTVHYAGALGKSVWILAPRVPEWRYGLHFDSMPWYPGSRMYRQRLDGDWDGLLAEVGRDLSSQFTVTS